MLFGTNINIAIGQVFFVIARKFALQNPSQKRLKEGMTPNLTHTLVSVGYSLTLKRVNQQHLNHVFFCQF